MKTARKLELPPERSRVMRRASIVEGISLAYLISVVIVMSLVMGSSQAMKAAWVEDLLSVIPPVVFFLSAHVRDWHPTQRFPYGYHRAVTIAFLAATLALVTMGSYLLIDSAWTLIQRKHPTIGTFELFGRTIWLGWLMIVALLYSAIPNVFLGRMKIRLARQLHDKTLFADGTMNKADWLTALAAIVGVLGIGLGWWWADAVAAAVIALDILRDGFKHAAAAIFDLMDRAPRTVDDNQAESLPARLVTEFKKLNWVRDASVRLRENGHVFFGEAYIQPVDQRQLVTRTKEAQELAYRLDWRMQELTVQIVHPTDNVLETEWREATPEAPATLQ